MTLKSTKRWWPRALFAPLLAVSLAWDGGMVAAQDDPLAPLEATLSEMTPPAATTGEPVLPADGRAAPGLHVLEVSLSEYFIYLPQVTGTIGTVRFQLENIGLQRHDLRVVGSGVDRQSPVLRAGQTGAVDVEFRESGLYSVYCDVGDHADRGMSLTFYVEEGVTQS